MFPCPFQPAGREAVKGKHCDACPAEEREAPSCNRLGAWLAAFRLLTVWFKAVPKIIERSRACPSCPLVGEANPSKAVLGVYSAHAILEIHGSPWMVEPLSHLCQRCQDFAALRPICDAQSLQADAIQALHCWQVVVVRPHLMRATHAQTCQANMGIFYQRSTCFKTCSQF